MVVNSKNLKIEFYRRIARQTVSSRALCDNVWTHQNDFSWQLSGYLHCHTLGRAPTPHRKGYTKDKGSPAREGGQKASCSKSSNWNLPDKHILQDFREKLNEPCSWLVSDKLWPTSRKSCKGRDIPRKFQTNTMPVRLTLSARRGTHVETLNSPCEKFASKFEVEMFRFSESVHSVKNVIIFLARIWSRISTTLPG